MSEPLSRVAAHDRSEGVRQRLRLMSGDAADRNPCLARRAGCLDGLAATDFRFPASRRFQCVERGVSAVLIRRPAGSLDGE